MKETFDHNLITSFYYWLNNTIQSEEAYTNKSSVLYPIEDTRFPSKYVYASPYRQWISDHSVSGAQIPSGVYVDGNFVETGVSGLSIDYEQGRVLFDSEIAETISGFYSIPDFNVYNEYDDSATLLFENTFVDRPTSIEELTGLATDVKTIPAIYMIYEDSRNEPFAFGGEDNTKMSVRCVVMSKNKYHIQGVFSILRDQSKKHFPLLSSSDFPFNYYGDYKDSELYNYKELEANKWNYENLIYVSKVSVSKNLPDNPASEAMSYKGFRGFIDFELEKVRTPRINK